MQPLGQGLDWRAAFAAEIAARAFSLDSAEDISSAVPRIVLAALNGRKALPKKVFGPSMATVRTTWERSMTVRLFRPGFFPVGAGQGAPVDGRVDGHSGVSGVCSLGPRRFQRCETAVRERRCGMRNDFP